METESFYFKVDLEFITEEARRWLWDYDKDLEKCIELLESCMQTDQLTENERRNIAVEILEGRKKMVGINTGSLVDDGENIRPLSLYIKRQKERILFLEMERDMDMYPKKYIDVCSPGKTASQYEYEDWTYNQVIWWRLYGTSKEEDIPRIGFSFEDHPLQGGCYLLFDHRLAFKILGGPCHNNEEVKTKCTSYFNTLLLQLKSEGKTYVDMTKYEKAVYDRNEICCKHVGLSFPFDTDVEYQQLLNINHIETSTDSDTDFFDTVNSNYKYHGRPDDQGVYYSAYGWVDPKGLWYSSDFGGHQVKSNRIVDAIEGYQQYYTEHRHDRNLVDPDDYMYMVKNDELPMLFLLDQGWVKMYNHEVFGDPYAHSNGAITDIQRKKLIEIAEYFRLSSHPVSQTLINWDDIKGADDSE